MSMVLEQRAPAMLPTRAQAVAQRLREMIQSGELPPGARLRQNEIAQRLGVSSTPVREAFALLQREGLVLARSHKGVVVFNPSFEEIEQVYEIRIPLECALLSKAIPNYAVADFRALREVLDAWDSTPDLQRPALNERFHALLYAPASRPRLEQMVRMLRDESGVYLRRVAQVWPDSHITGIQHEAIYQACLDRDVDRAAAELKVHLEYTVQVLRDYLRR